jgi:hypothetical protein
MWFKRHIQTSGGKGIAILISAGLLIGLATIAYGFVWSPTANAKPEGPVYFLDATDGATNVHYGVAYSDGQLNGGVTYEFRTAEGVRKYLDFNRRTIEKLLQSNQSQIYALVVFNRPLPQGEFEQFVQSYGMNPYAYSLRAVAPNGMRTTIYGGPANGSLIPADTINMIAKDIQERDNTSIRGWIDVSTVISRPNLVKLMNDPRVYTVDATETLFRNSITPTKLDSAGANSDIVRAATQGDLHIQISRVSLYWSLEDLGLVGTK